MAEIRVERKERRSLLPWILGLVLLALIVWGLVEVANRMTRLKIAARRRSMSTSRSNRRLCGSTPAWTPESSKTLQGNHEGCPYEWAPSPLQGQT